MTYYNMGTDRFGEYVVINSQPNYLTCANMQGIVG